MKKVIDIMVPLFICILLLVYKSYGRSALEKYEICCDPAYPNETCFIVGEGNNREEYCGRFCGLTPKGISFPIPTFSPYKASNNVFICTEPTPKGQNPIRGIGIINASVYYPEDLSSSSVGQYIYFDDSQSVDDYNIWLTLIGATR